MKVISMNEPQDGLYRCQDRDRVVECKSCTREEAATVKRGDAKDQGRDWRVDCVVSANAKDS